jgi:hypothetical protein
LQVVREIRGCLREDEGAADVNEAMDAAAAPIVALLEERDMEWAEAAIAAGRCGESMDGQEGPHLGRYGEKLHADCGCKQLRRLIVESGYYETHEIDGD